MTRSDSSLLDEQADYYRARAPEYDEWWRRQGRYDHGAEAAQHWHEEVAEVAAALDRLPSGGNVLELACGTGWWTERLARRADRLTCVDNSPEMLAANRDRLTSAGLSLPRYVRANLFDWTPDAKYDLVFFSFWLSHVPDDRFTGFWDMVADALAPAGRAFLIDSLPDMTATAHDHRSPDAAGIQERRLNDGRPFQIVKRFRDAGDLGERLAVSGWRTDFAQTAHYFVYGSADHTKAIFSTT